MCGLTAAYAVAAGCTQHPGTDILQFDPALSYGLVEYLRTIDMLETNGWSRTDCVPHGGHLFALHIAAGLGLGGNEAYPGVFQPFGGFVDGVTPENGYVRLVSQEKPRRASTASLVLSVSVWLTACPCWGAAADARGRLRGYRHRAEGRFARSFHAAAHERPTCTSQA